MRLATPRDTRQLSLLLTLGCFALGQGVQVANGNLHPASMRWLTVAVIATLVAVAAPTWSFLEHRAETLAVALAGFGTAYELFELISNPPGMYLRVAGPADALPLTGGLIVAGIAAGAGLAKKPWLGWGQLVLLLGAYLVMGRWMLVHSPQPHIDVFYFQRDGVAELMAGRNPFAMQYTDIYGNSPFYGEGMSVNGKLQFGFPYMPLSLLLVLPAQLSLGDYRWMQLFSMAATAFFIATAVPSRLSRALAALYLFTPRSLFVLEQGWTDSVVLMLVAATVWTAIRFPRALPVVLGLAFAVKQTMAVAVPAAWLLLPRPLPPRKELIRFLAITVGVGVVVTLPFFLWDPAAFWHDVVVLQFLQPFRTEAMSYLAWYAQETGTRLPTSLAFLGAAVGAGLGLWRRPATASGFAATLALAFVLFFAFNKQAFCNYYYFTLGVMAVAAASVRVED